MLYAKSFIKHSSRFPKQNGIASTRYFSTCLLFVKETVKVRLTNITAVNCCHIGVALIIKWHVVYWIHLASLLQSDCQWNNNQQTMRNCVFLFAKKLEFLSKIAKIIFISKFQRWIFNEAMVQRQDAPPLCETFALLLLNWCSGIEYGARI